MKRIALLLGLAALLCTSYASYRLGKHRADRWWNASVRSDKEFLYIYNVSFPGQVTLKAKRANLIGNYFEKGVTFSDGEVVSIGDAFMPIDTTSEPMATWCSEKIKEQRSIH